MSYPKKIIKVRPTGGIVNDIDPSEVGPNFWTDGNNVHFRDGFAVRTTGETAVYDDLQDDIRHIRNLQAGGVNYWLYFGIDSVYVVETTNHTDISPSLSTISALNQWTSGILNGVPFGNNGVDTPQYWGLDTGTAMAELSNWPSGASCYSMIAHRYNLFALGWFDGSGDYPMDIHWSNSAEPGTIPTAWTAAATNDAGSISLSATPGAIVHGAPLRGSLIVYKQHSAYSVDYIGGQYVYDARKLFITVGMLNRNCAAEVNGMHYLLADGDVVVTDGNTAQSVVDKRMRNWLFNQLDQSNFEGAFVVPYRQQNEVWVCFPSSGNTACDLALVIDTTEGRTLGIRELPSVYHAAVGVIDDTADSQVIDDQSQIIDTDHSLINQQSYKEANDSLVLAYSDDASPTDSKLFQVDVGTDFNGTGITANVKKHKMTFDEPNRVKLIRRLIPHVDAAASTDIICRVGSSMSADGSTTWEAEQTYTVGTDEHLDFLTQGKFISVEARSSGGAAWTLLGFDLEGELRGYH